VLPELANMAPQAIDDLLLVLIDARIFKKEQILQDIVLGQVRGHDKPPVVGAQRAEAVRATIMVARR